MEERIRPTRSGLFSIELLICVGVFVFCAAVCTGIFARAELMSRESAELNLAVNEARSLAECFQAAGGDWERTRALCGGETESDPESDPENGDPEHGDLENGDPESDNPENSDPENSDPENREAEHGDLVLRREGLLLRLTPTGERTGTLTVSGGGRVLLKWKLTAWEVAT